MSSKNFSTETILANLNIDALNEMQVASIAAQKEHNNIIILSATGSGKTLAFLLPVVESLDLENKHTQAIVIVPTRELSIQIEGVFKRMGTGFKITNCYGGHKREIEENNLVQPPALIVGTPGRICDHIRRGSITVDSIKMMVLDEFDKSLELGFQEEMLFIVNSLKNVDKHILTSATDLEELPDFLEFEAPHKLNFLPEGAVKSENLRLKAMFTPEKDKSDLLFRLICALGNKTAIIFCNFREVVEETSQFLLKNGIYNEFYHGAMEQQERDTALCKFRNGTTNILVTTDLAARGLDISNIKNIIHYQLPQTKDSFIHRNGRTARMDTVGSAILMVGGGERLPDYVDKDVETIQFPDSIKLPDKPSWTTLFIAAGKKDKVNKVDVVGFLTQVGQLKKEDIGLIEVKDFFLFVAIRKNKISEAFELIKNEKIKNKKVKIALAK